MGSKQKKDVKLRAFKIENDKLSKNNSGLFSILKDKLTNSFAQDRRMLLNQDDPNHEEDLISDFEISKASFVNGTVLRIMPATDTSNIPKELFELKKISMSELEKSELDASFIYKDNYAFLLDDNYLITSLPGNKTIVRFQTYINWLLRSKRGSTIFEFTPIVEAPGETKLCDLKEIVFNGKGNLAAPDTHKKNSDNVGKNLIAVGLDQVKNILRDTSDFDEIVDKKIVSAQLLIKFKKPHKMSDEEYAKTLGATLKPVSDLDHISYKTKSGKNIKGKDVLKTKKVSIELTESGKISENQLFLQMEDFLNELNNAQNNN